MRPGQYAAYVVVSAAAVACMAWVQFTFVLHTDPTLRAFLVPIVVGASFGGIVARIRDLSARQREAARELESREKTITELNERLQNQLEVTTTAHSDVEARYSRLVDASVDAILNIEPDGKILLANRAAVRLLGLPAESVLGRKLQQLKVLNAADCDAIDAAMRRLCGTPGHETLPLTVRRPDWSQRIVEAVVQCSGVQAPERQSALLVIRDVTESRQIADLGQRLQRSQRLEALGKLAAGIAHDFNNLLSVVLTNVELMDGAPSDDARAEHAEAIREAAERGTSITRQLLAVGRRQVLSPRVVDLCARVGDLEDILTRLAGTDHRVVLELDPKPCLAEIDPAQIDQILFNLVVNARDAMPEGGAVVIAVSRTDGREAPQPSDSEAGWVRVLVRDTGGGMDEQALARCTEPFFTTKSAKRGTGLGLSTVQGIVEQSGGRLEIDSIVGEGTTVAILLPETLDPVQPSDPPLEATTSQLGGRVLLVEDEPALRIGARALLERAGLRVETAEDGLAAKATLESAAEEFDLVISDIVMPRMSGTELARWIEETKPGLPVLLATGHPGAAPVEGREGSHGSHELIQKPFSGAELLERVERLLS